MSEQALRQILLAFAKTFILLYLFTWEKFNLLLDYIISKSSNLPLIFFFFFFFFFFLSHTQIKIKNEFLYEQWKHS